MSTEEQRAAWRAAYARRKARMTPQHAARYREAGRIQQARYRAPYKAHALAQKYARGACLDCGLQVTPENYVAFDWDHRDPSTKRFDIPNGVTKAGVGLDELQAEIDKCDLRCSNCHRIRTWRLGHTAHRRAG